MPLVRWSVRTLTTQRIDEGVFTSIPDSSVCLLLQAADLQPHRTRYGKRGWDPAFVPKAVHVLWYYEQAAALAPMPVDGLLIAERVLWYYEQASRAGGGGGAGLWCRRKPGMQLLGRAHTDPPPRGGCPRRRDFEYRRLGTGRWLLIVDVVTGKLFGRTPPAKSSAHFTAALEEHRASLGRVRRVHDLVDNDSTPVSAHPRQGLQAQQGRVRFHHTPKYASWLNQGEIGLNCFHTSYLRDRVWESPEDFPAHVLHSQDHCWRWRWPAGWAKRPFRARQRRRRGSADRDHRRVRSAGSAHDDSCSPWQWRVAGRADAAAACRSA